MKTTPETKEEARVFEHINATTRQRNAEHEAQESARTHEAVERARDTHAIRKWRCTLNLSLCAVFMASLYALYVTEHISVFVTAYAISFVLVCVGWHLNEAKRIFRRKG